LFANQSHSPKKSGDIVHKPSEYNRFYDVCWAKAHFLSHKLEEQGITTGKAVLDFLTKHGYRGIVTSRVGEFGIGRWLTRPGKPAQQKEGVAWLMYMDDDKLPAGQSGTAMEAGAFNRTNQMICMFDVNIWSPMELAIFFLHQGYHAYHRLSFALDKAFTFENEEQHETNNWLFNLNLMQVGGGEAWQRVVQHELKWIEQTRTIKPEVQIGKINFSLSHQYWPEFDIVFGDNLNPKVRACRSFMAALQAHMVYYSKKGYSPEVVCHSIISHEYSQRQ
jgi:hypothetical protein